MHRCHEFWLTLRPSHSHRFPGASRAQARVRGHGDPVFLAKRHEFRLLEVQVVFILKVIWDYPARVQYPSYLLDVEVRQTDRLGQATVNLVLHGLKPKRV